MNKVNYKPNLDFDVLLLKEDCVFTIVKHLYSFSDILMNSLDKNEPSILSRYLIDLAQSFSNFYNQCQVLTEDEKLQNARLFLTYSVGNVLKIGTGILGIEMPEKM